MLSNKSILPYILGGIGLVLALVVLVSFLSGSSTDSERQQLKVLADRIQALENNLASVGLIDQAFARIDNNQKELNLIMERLDRFEGSVTTQIDQIIKELGKLHQKIGRTSASTAKAPPPDLQSTPENKTKIHRVSQGETLYSISRRYGLTVEQLRSYNDIGKDLTIYPGQKLKLSRP